MRIKKLEAAGAEICLLLFLKIGSYISHNATNGIFSVCNAGFML